MAGEGRELSTRMSSENQNIDNRPFYETVFRHFKRQKVQISNAIKKTFPFFEGLRDNELITSKMYEDCQDSCRNLVPVPRVVYNVLSELEKTFNLSLLEALFSEVNMQEYPDLNHIYKSFENVIQEKINYEESNGQKRPAIQLSLEQGTGGDFHPSLTSSQAVPLPRDGMTPRENGLSDRLSETEKMNAKMKDRKSDQDGALESQQANEQCSQESEPAGAKPYNHGLQINSCSVHLVDIKKEKPFFNSEVQQKAQARTHYNQVSDIIVISSEDSAESSDGDEFSEPSTSTPGRITDPSATGSMSIFRMNSRKRRMRSGDSTDLSNEGEPQATSSSALRNGSGRETVCTESLKTGRKRGPRALRDTNVDFQSEQLPVTCGKATGTLYKEKMKKGSSEKCIKDENGMWHTLREFEKLGGLERSRNWKKSVRCCGQTLEKLIQEGRLPNPPRKRKKPENSKKCEVCGKKNKLLSCDTCPRFFHGNCHIPRKVATKNPWSCTFCQIEDLKKCCSESQPIYQESEILQKQMVPREQLKCEFLLLKLYCSPKSSFFVSEPHYTTVTSRDIKEPMWLKKIKKKLAMTLYRTVREFMQDVRLIFQNHKVVYRNKNFINLGLQLEVQFEDDFKDIFGIQEISTNST